MARRFCNVVLAVLLVAPWATGAQVSIQPTPAPTVTADSAPWFQARESIMFAGNVYYPAGAQVHFNRTEMTFSGYYGGVPVYTRVTLEPYSVVFIPVSGGLLQPYERRRTGEIAGTVGSTTPSFPVVSPAERAASGQLPSVPQSPGPATSAYPSVSEAVPPAPLPAGTSGRSEPSPVSSHRVISSARPEGLNGIFVEYNGRRWFSSGSAVRFDPARFVQIGTHRGSPVYRNRNTLNTIFVAVAPSADSLLAPYSRRRGSDR
jgi:hypothetical protein